MKINSAWQITFLINFKSITVLSLIRLHCYPCGLLNVWNIILQVSFCTPLADSVEGLEFDLTFFIASTSLAVSGKFSTSRYPPLFDKVSNHDGWWSKQSLPGWKIKQNKWKLKCMGENVPKRYEKKSEKVFSVKCLFSSWGWNIIFSSCVFCGKRNFKSGQ